jgi:ubiquinone/menaquinone biosynthesis C-methylase UbiE
MRALLRILEPEVMDGPDEAAAYDAMDHAAVNAVFVKDLLTFAPQVAGRVLDVGTGTARIPIELARRAPSVHVVAADAAPSMLELAAKNVAAAGLIARITPQLVNARTLPFTDGEFPTVVSNSIVHHIAEPGVVIAEMARVCAAGGVIFVRDLARPADLATLSRLVETYAADANAHQRQLFADSLHAALTVEEVCDLVTSLGFAAGSVSMTSDRHWTWATVKV